MCLAVPGKVIEWLERESPFAEGIVEFAGVRRRTNLACVPDVAVGDFVLVHAGVAINRLETDEAEHILQTLEEIDFNSPSDDAETAFGGEGKRA